jgi:hypothetical protein
MKVSTSLGAFEAGRSGAQTSHGGQTQKAQNSSGFAFIQATSLILLSSDTIQLLVDLSLAQRILRGEDPKPPGRHGDGEGIFA